MIIYDVVDLYDRYITLQYPAVKKSTMQIILIDVDIPDGVTMNIHDDRIHINNQYVQNTWYDTKNVLISRSGKLYIKYGKIIKQLKTNHTKCLYY